MPDGSQHDRLDDFLALAEQLADTSGPIIRRWYRDGFAVEDKPDDSPVTQADREAESALRALIAKAFPTHGIIGEEHGRERAEADYVWVLDPIDGTRRFITGHPWFGTLIALTHQGRPLLGLIDIPMLRQRWVGVQGRPTLQRDETGTREVRTRSGVGLADALLAATSPHMFEGAAAAAFERLRGAVKFPLYGGECFSYGALAGGGLDLVVEADMAIYDFLAQVPVIEGAGGKITDWQGRPLGLHSGDKVLAAGDSGLHSAALALLAAD